MLVEANESTEEAACLRPVSPVSYCHRQRLFAFPRYSKVAETDLRLSHPRRGGKHMGIACARDDSVTLAKAKGCHAAVRQLSPARACGDDVKWDDDLRFG